MSCELRGGIHFCGCVVLRLRLTSSDYFVCVCVCLCSHFSVVIELRGDESMNLVKIWSLRDDGSAHNTLYLFYHLLPSLAPLGKRKCF